jgi:hypothetical protein
MLQELFGQEKNKDTKKATSMMNLQSGSYKIYSMGEMEEQRR